MPETDVSAQSEFLFPEMKFIGLLRGQKISWFHKKFVFLFVNTRHLRVGVWRTFKSPEKAVWRCVRLIL